MKEIQLTRGKVTLVDDEDFDWLNQYSWCVTKGAQTYYALRRLNKDSFIKMHQQIIGKAPLGFVIDHQDDNGLNNQRSNLHFITQRENVQYKNIVQSSLYPGVSWDKSRNSWRVHIQLGKKRKYLGRFTNEEEAAQVYRTALDEFEEKENHLPMMTIDKLLALTIRVKALTEKEIKLCLR